MKNRADTVVTLVCGLALLVAMAVAQAQELADPTRPPAAADKAGPVPGAAGASAGGLQAIVRRQGMKPAAVINGEYVELGGRSGDAHIVAIGGDTVTLESAHGRETLSLSPGVDKTPAGETGGKKGAGGKKAGEGTAK